MFRYTLFAYGYDDQINKYQQKIGFLPNLYVNVVPLDIP